MDALENRNSAKEEGDGEKNKSSVIVEDNSSLVTHDDILHDILLRLPVKSLLRFKTVSKRWLALISDPRFIKLLSLTRDIHTVGRIHMSSHSLSYRVQPTTPKMIEEEEERPWTISLTSMNSTASEIQDAEIKHYPFKVPPRSVDVLGSCNGLLLVAVSDETFLWNPSTGECKMLSTTSNLWETRHDCNRCSSGLGYNSLLDEYKAVILLGDYLLHTEERCEFHMFMFTSRTGCWKEVDQDLPCWKDVDHDLPCWEEVDRNLPCLIDRDSSRGITVNGCPHWVAYYFGVYDFTRHDIIIYFDMVDEKFKRVPTPIMSWFNIYYRWSFRIALMGGRFCAIHFDYYSNEDGRIDVWEMKEYGVNESWTMLFSILPSSDWIRDFVPLGFTNNGNEVVLEIDGRKVITYNLKTKEEKFILGTTSDDDWRYGRLNSVEYVESLVSPCAYLDKCKNRIEEEEEP